MRRARTYWGWVAALLCVCAVVAPARVFVRWKAADNPDRTLSAIGGQLAYEAAVTMNGAPGRLTVHGFSTAIHTVVRDLADAFGIEDFQYADETMGVGKLGSDTSLLRFLVIRFPAEGKTLVFTIQQDRDALARARARDADDPLRELPPYPGSESVFEATDSNARMSIAVSRASAAPSEVHAFFEDRLSTSGWLPGLPRADGTNRSVDTSLRLYHRGPEVCCVLAEPSDSGIDTRITVLHKTLRVK